MSEHVFLVHCLPSDFEETVATTVNVNAFTDTPSGLEGDAPIRLWGAPTGSNNDSYVDQMKEGGLVLFHTNGVFRGAGDIGVMIEDESGWANTHLWEDFESDHVFTVREYTDISVPKAAVNRIFGYSDGYTPGKLMRVADTRVTNSTAAIKLALQKYTEKHESD